MPGRNPAAACRGSCGDVEDGRRSRGAHACGHRYGCVEGQGFHAEGKGGRQGRNGRAVDRVRSGLRGNECEEPADRSHHLERRNGLWHRLRVRHCNGRQDPRVDADTQRRSGDGRGGDGPDGDFRGHYSSESERPACAAGRGFEQRGQDVPKRHQTSAWRPFCKRPQRHVVAGSGDCEGRQGPARGQGTGRA